MSIIIDATYEGGVLKPEGPLPLTEHQRVRVTVEPRQKLVGADRNVEPASEASQLSLAERIAALAGELPAEEIDAWPTDGASQHDHYLYGTPKRLE